MKKLYISVDIEGVCGIVDWKETEIGEAQGAYFRSQMTKETAAACRAALAGGVGSILVKDAHGSGRSIDPAALPEQVRLMRAWTRDPYSMMAGIDGSFTGACYIGYHSAAGSDGNPLAHTMNGNAHEIRMNGIQASEFLLNAYTAASFGVPSLLVSGDQALCDSAAVLVPGIRTVPVMEGIGNASLSIHPELAIRRIGEAMSDVLSPANAAQLPGLLPKLPAEFELSVLFRHHYLAHRASFYPGARKEGSCGLVYRAKSWLEIMSFIMFAL